MNEHMQGELIVPDSSRARSREVTTIDKPVTTPMQLIAIAVQRGEPIEKLQQLLALKREWEADEARKAYTSAMAAFKSNPPKILKEKQVSYTKKDGSVTEYKHATLGSVCSSIIKGLSEHGISHRWMTEQNNGRIKVTCVLTHSAGHSESTTLEAAPDDSGNKNSIQAIGSAVSYLERYTLLSATGLATDDMDDDGQATSAKPAYITETQYADLLALIDELGGNRDRLRVHLKVESLDKIYASKFEAVCNEVRALAKAREQARQQKGK